MVGLTPMTNHVPINRSVRQCAVCWRGGSVFEAEFPIVSMSSKRAKRLDLLVLPMLWYVGRK